MTTKIESNAQTIHTALTATLSYQIVAKQTGMKDRNRSATYTLTNDETGSHITFRIRTPKGYKTMLVDVMTGSCNESDYEYIGSMNRGLHIKDSKKGTSAAAEKKVAALKWYMAKAIKAVNATRNMERSEKQAEAGIISQQELAKRKQATILHPKVSLHHSGKCMCCGRKLTNPESLATGIGPICGGRL